MTNIMFPKDKIINIKLPNITTELKGEDVPINGLVVIKSIPDGSCLFHSVLRAFNKQYNESDIKNRVNMVLDMRKNLSDALSEKFTPEKTYYQFLSSGNLSLLGDDMKRYSLERLKIELNSTRSVGMEFIEALGLFLDLDIYIIDMTKLDLYFVGLDLENYYKNRKSIVLAYEQSLFFDDGHYDTIGLNVNGNIYTLFEPDNFFIISLKKRYMKKQSKIKKFLIKI